MLDIIHSRYWFINQAGNRNFSALLLVQSTPTDGVKMTQEAERAGLDLKGVGRSCQNKDRCSGTKQDSHNEGTICRHICVSQSDFVPLESIRLDLSPTNQNYISEEMKRKLN
jgi:hypothetical protein